MSCCSTNARPLPNAFEELASSTTTTLTITPARANHAVDLTVSGSARTTIVVLSRARQRAGNIIEFKITLPATADIILEFRNGSTTGDLLLPEEKYPDQLFTTDGVFLSAKLRFVYTGSAWRYSDSQIPA